MNLAYAVLLLVAVQRVAELLYAARNTRRLRAEGGIELGAGHYPLIVLLHAAWWLSMMFAVGPETQADLPLLVGFALLQGARLWVILTLGRFWTTRIITLPGAPLVRRGVYRWIRHPNYLVVVLEIAVLPLAFDWIWQALIFSALNALLLRHRIRIEAAALAPRRGLDGRELEGRAT